MTNYHLLAPINQSASHIDSVFSQSPMRPYAKDIMNFIEALSQALLTEAKSKTHSELVALGFWLRPANIKQLIGPQEKGVITKALGTVLHFTPANVDSMFVYSWVCSLLMGNNNIVRVSSAESEAKTALLECLNQVLCHPDFTSIAIRNQFVSYPRASSITQQLSLQADARVIWGGDDSVKAIRAVPCQPRCRDISFADRYSACLINGDMLQSKEQVEQLAVKLWRDTEPHNQQACSSPRLVIWLGDTAQQQALFEAVDELAGKFKKALPHANNQLVLAQLMQSTGRATVPLVKNNILALPIAQFVESDLKWHTGAGAYFVLNQPLQQNDHENVKVLALVITEKMQTLSTWQVPKELTLKLIAEPSIKGIDRIVPVGQALEFAPMWDGYDVMGQLSRNINLAM